MLEKFELPLAPAHDNKSYSAKFRCRTLYNSKYPNSLSFLGPNISARIYNEFNKTGIKENLPLYTKEDNLNQAVFPIFLDFDSTPYETFEELHCKLSSILDPKVFNIGYSPSGRVKVWFLLKTPSIDIKLKHILSHYDDQYIKSSIIRYIKNNILSLMDHHLLAHIDPCINGMFRCYISPSIKKSWNITTPIDINLILPELDLVASNNFHWESDLLIAGSPTPERREKEEYTLCTYVSRSPAPLQRSYNGEIPEELRLRSNNLTGTAIQRVLLATPRLLESFYLNQKELANSVNALYGLSASQQSVSKQLKSFIQKGWLKVVRTYIKGVSSTYYQATGELRDHLMRLSKPTSVKPTTPRKEPIKVVHEGMFWGENVRAYKRFFRDLEGYWNWAQNMLKLSSNFISTKRYNDRFNTIKATKRRIKKDLMH